MAWPISSGSISREDNASVVLYGFDLPAVDGVDLRDEPPLMTAAPSSGQVRPDGIYLGLRLRDRGQKPPLLNTSEISTYF